MLVYRGTVVHDLGITSRQFYAYYRSIKGQYEYYPGQQPNTPTVLGYTCRRAQEDTRGNVGVETLSDKHLSIVMCTEALLQENRQQAGGARGGASLCHTCYIITGNLIS